MLCTGSNNPNAGNGGGLYMTISGESITARTAFTVINCDMQSNIAGGGGTVPEFYGKH